MKIPFTKLAWEDYNYWNEVDKKVVKKINKLIN